MTTITNIHKHFFVILILVFSQSACAHPKLENLKESKVKEIPIAEISKQEEKIEIVTLPNFFVAGFSMKTAMKEDKIEKDVEKLWDKFNENYDPELYHKRSDDKIYFVMHNYKNKGEDGLEILVGFRMKNVSGVDKKYSHVEIKSGSFAKDKPKGTSADEVIEAWEKIYGLKLNRIYTYDIEAYTINEEFELTDVDLFISVKN